MLTAPLALTLVLSAFVSVLPRNQVLPVPTAPAVNVAPTANVPPPAASGPVPVNPLSVPPVLPKSLRLTARVDELSGAVLVSVAKTDVVAPVMIFSVAGLSPLRVWFSLCCRSSALPMTLTT